MDKQSEKIIEEPVDSGADGFKTPEGDEESEKDWAEQVARAQQMDEEKARREKEEQERLLLEEEERQKDPESENSTGEPKTSNPPKELDLTKSQRDRRAALQRQSISNSTGTAATNNALALKLRTQATRWAAIEELSERIRKVKISKQYIGDLEAWEKLINNYWSQFSHAHEKLCEEAADDLMTSSYIQEDHHGQLMTIYSSATESIEVARAKIRALSQLASNQMSSSSRGDSGLARLEPPPFSGEYSDWKAFSDISLSMVGNKDISPAENFVRLRKALTGQAADLIKSISPTAENYAVAWKKLVSRYENPRWIKNAHFARLSKLQPLKEKSAEGLLTLIGIISEILDALKALGEPVESWTSLISYRLRELIDVETREAWEVEIGDSTGIPPLEQFISFIQARARAIEHSQVDRQSSKKHQANQIYHGAVQQDTANQDDGKPKLKCPCCKGPHHLGPACAAFQGMSPQATRQHVREKNRCYNCLGPHSASDCKSKFRCLNCKGKHHTLIHIGAPGQASAIRTPGTEPPGSGGSSATSTSVPASHSAGITPKSNLSNITNNPDIINMEAAATSRTSISSGKSLTKASETTSASNEAGIPSTDPDIQVANNANYHPGSSILHNHRHTAEAKGLHGTRDPTISVVLLATARVQALAAIGTAKIPARILIDTGSEISCISKSLVQRLRLIRTAESIRIIGIGGKTSVTSRGAAELILQSYHEPEQTVKIQVHILPRLTAQLPSISCESTSIEITNGLKLADEDFLKPRHIDIILGTDHYAEIIGNGIRKAADGKIVAQLTIFGWVIYGPINCINNATRTSLTAVRETCADQLLDLMKRFWSQEEVNSKLSRQQLLDPEELECEEFFKKTHQRDSSGRYIVRLPLKSSTLALGESRPKALRLLHQTARKLSSNPIFNQLYTEFLKNNLEKGHMHQVPESEESSDTCPVFYLPHHGVLREESVSTKLRVVVNGSSKTSTGISLNDILHPGQNLQLDGSDVLTWFRLHRMVFGTDISQMFRQIQLNRADWDLQRILWFDERQKPTSFRLSTVTYGLNCTPFLALRVLDQLKEDEGDNYPAAISSMSKGRYMDDIFGGAETVEELKEIIINLKGLCMAGGFPLHKWVSNQPEVLRELNLTPGNSSSIKELEESVIKVLGLGWHPSTDTFQYKSRRYTKTASTKREILSEIAQIYDPLGLIAPVVIRAKIFIQELWLLKVNWDDQLPIEFIKRWKEFRGAFEQLDTFSF